MLACNLRPGMTFQTRGPTGSIVEMIISVVERSSHVKSFLILVVEDKQRTRIITQTCSLAQSMYVDYWTRIG